MLTDILKSKSAAIIGLVVGAFFIGILLSRVFGGAVILPQQLDLGPVSVRYYGLFLAIAVTAGYILASRRAPAYGIKQDQVDKLIIYLVVSGFIGARLYHVISSWEYYVSGLVAVVKIWQGGLSIFGAIIGGAVGLWWASKKMSLQVSVWRLLDWLAPSVLLGQIIGRFGNLFNYELFGYPTALPWGMYVPEQFRPVSYFDFRFFHPLFLYESLLNLVFFVALLILSRRIQYFRKPGTLFFSYLFLYNAGRFFLEMLRIDSVFIGGIRLNSLTSGMLTLGSLVILIFLRYAFNQPHDSQRNN